MIVILVWSCLKAIVNVKFAGGLGIEAVEISLIWLAFCPFRSTVENTIRMQGIKNLESFKQSFKAKPHQTFLIDH